MLVVLSISSVFINLPNRIDKTLVLCGFAVESGRHSSLDCTFVTQACLILNVAVVEVEDLNGKLNHSMSI